MKFDTRFCPDLVVEVTNACNLQCDGCYATNILITKKRHSNVTHLSSNHFRQKIRSFTEESLPRDSVIAFRGGEPSLSPEISELLIIASTVSNNVYLESNGLWLLEKNTSYSHLISTLLKTAATLKLSFDNLHHTSTKTAEQIINKAKFFSLPVCFGITAHTPKEFTSLVDKFSLHDAKVFYQPFVSNKSELTPPKLGLIKQNGSLRPHF